MRICVVGASGKLGRYMVQHALDRGYEVVAVCRDKSVGKLAEFEGRINIVPGATDDREVIKRAVAGCDGVLVVLVPRGVHGYSSCSSRGGCTVTRRERPRRSSTTRTRGRGWCSRAGGTSLVMARTFIRGGSRHSSTSPAVSHASPGWPTSTTRWRRLSASSPATPAGPSCVAATSRRATARACQCGAATWATPSSRATSRAAWTSPCSWWRPSKTTILFTRPRRSSAARVPRRSRTQLPEQPRPSDALARLQVERVRPGQRLGNRGVEVLRDLLTQVETSERLDKRGVFAHRHAGRARRSHDAVGYQAASRRDDLRSACALVLQRRCAARLLRHRDPVVRAVAPR